MVTGYLRHFDSYRSLSSQEIFDPLEYGNDLQLKISLTILSGKFYLSFAKLRLLRARLISLLPSVDR